MKQKIVTKLSIVGLSITLCVGAVITSTIIINKKGIADGHIVNISGRERMLSQRISKEVFIINSQDKFDFTDLDIALNEFQGGLDILKFGDAKMSIPSQSEEKIQEQLKKIDSIWIQFRESVNKFKTSIQILHADKEFLDENNKKMLAFSDNIVKAMVKEGLSGESVDDSGRQRMLTQRMAYHLMRYTNKWDTQSYEDFFNAFKLYNETILRFYMSPTYNKLPELAEQIKKTYDFWLIYSKHVYSVLSSQKNVVEALNNIAIQNDELLAEIEKVVHMYAQLSVQKRTYLEKLQYASVFILFLLLIYSISVVRSIKNIFDEFTQKIKELSKFKDNSELAKSKIDEIVLISGQSELSEVAKNISTIIGKTEFVSKNSNRAKELSENITSEISIITEEVIKSINSLNISSDEKEKIISEVSLSEDIAIQTSEELISVSKLLKRLKSSLDTITKYYEPNKKEE